MFALITALLPGPFGKTVVLDQLAFTFQFCGLAVMVFVQ